MQQNIILLYFHQSVKLRWKRDSWDFRHDLKNINKIIHLIEKWFLFVLELRHFRWNIFSKKLELNPSWILKSLESLWRNCSSSDIFPYGLLLDSVCIKSWLLKLTVGFGFRCLSSATIFSQFESLHPFNTKPEILFSFWQVANSVH